MEDPFAPVTRHERCPAVFEEHTLAHPSRHALRAVYSSRALNRPVYTPPPALRPFGSLRRILVEERAGPANRQKPTKASVLNSTIEASNARNDSSRAKTGRDEADAIHESIGDFLQRTGFSRADQVHVAVVDSDWHRKANGDNVDHLRVIFFEIIARQVYVQMWKDLNPDGMGRTSVIHVYRPSDAHHYAQGPAWVPDGIAAEGDVIPGTNWFFRDAARFMPFRTLRDAWDGIARKQRGQTLEELVASCEQYFHTINNTLMSRAFPS